MSMDDQPLDFTRPSHMLYAAVRETYGPTNPDRDSDPRLVIRWPGEAEVDCAICGHHLEPAFVEDEDHVLPTIRLFHKHLHPGQPFDVKECTRDDH